ncbi:MAG: 4-vinyl reductase, partial [Neisseriaceae bacterium]|nr:4-vinyl reductase [Neisseriaceae bacterium]
EATGVWSSDGLPMIYVPRHFFVNNHLAVEAALGKAAYAGSLYQAGHQSAYFWCQQAAQTYGLGGLSVYQHYLQRLSQRGWGQFAFLSVDVASGHAQISLHHSVFVLAQGVAGVPVVADLSCYLFSGWFSGAMDWVAQDLGFSHRTSSTESQCAAQGHDHCVFTVKPR